MSLSTDNAYHRFGLSAMLEKSKKKKKKEHGWGSKFDCVSGNKAEFISCYFICCLGF